MLTDVRSLIEGQPCAILGVGHTELGAEYQFDNRRFILNPDKVPGALSPLGRRQLFNDLSLGAAQSEDELVALADEKFIATTGIRSRMIFDGTVGELAAMAGRQALFNAQVESSEIDAIIVGSNTGSGYPSTADRVKNALGVPLSALCFDVQEACPVGAIAVELAWKIIRGRFHRRVLVVAAEKATTLASADDYKGANLFGDAAFAFVLGASTTEDFIFFNSGSDPYDEKAEYINRTPDGFTQNGRAVHKYVGKVIPDLLGQTFEQLRLDPSMVHHFFPHQPSAKTLDFLIENLQARWPTFSPVIHRNVEEMGNTSGACTGWMISRAKARGELKPGEFCLVATFGSGMSWGLYGFIVR